MSYAQNSSLGLPGLRPIRQALGLQLDKFSEMVATTPTWIGLVETGQRDCTQKLQRRIADTIGCTPLDLLTQNPPEDRLAEIRAAYLRRQADQAEAALEKMEGVA